MAKPADAELKLRASIAEHGFKQLVAARANRHDRDAEGLLRLLERHIVEKNALAVAKHFARNEQPRAELPPFELGDEVPACYEPGDVYSVAEKVVDHSIYPSVYLITLPADVPEYFITSLL